MTWLKRQDGDPETLCTIHHVDIEGTVHDKLANCRSCFKAACMELRAKCGD